MAKCLKYGWYLPYSPPEYETGSWKRHYIACAQTLDYVTSSVSIQSCHQDVTVIFVLLNHYLLLSYKDHETGNCTVLASTTWVFFEQLLTYVSN